MIEEVIIYSKNGVAKHESKTGYNNDGELVKTFSLEYHGTWMGDCYVNLTVHSGYPIDFQIGDYIVYRGERFTLANDPAVVKASSRGTYGEGFDYKDIKFSSRGTELSDICFLDVVLADNEIHYTALPDFPFYAATIEDYADRLQANTNRWCTENGFVLTDYWLFVTPNKNRFIQRAGCLRKNINDQWEGLSVAQATTIWEGIYGSDGSHKAVDNEKTDVSITISGENISDSLARIKNDFGLNFINRDRKVIIGAAGIELSHLFKYGKNDGLYEMERQVDNDQQVITKLYAYGSEKNMPVRYYANVQKDYFDYCVSYIAEYHDRFGVTDYELEFIADLEIDYNDDMFTKPSNSTDWRYNGIVDEKFEVEVMVDNHSIIAYAFRKPDSDKLSLYSIAGNSQLTYHMSTKAELEAFVAAVRVSDKIFFTKHINKKTWPEEKYEYSNIYSRGYAVVNGDPYTHVKTEAQVDLEVYTNTNYVRDSFVFRSRTNPGNDNNPNFVCTLKVGDIKVVGRIQRDEYGKCTIRVCWDSEYYRDYFEKNRSAAVAFYDAVTSGTTIYICSGIDYKTFPTVDTEYTEPDLPNNMSVNKLMLPGFPTQSLYAWVKSQPDCTAHNDATGEATWRGHTAIFSREKYRPFVLSLNHTELGIREGRKNFDGSDDSDEIYPTLEGTGYDIIYHADVMGDNGVFEEDAETPTIKLTVPNFDDEFDQILEDGTANGGTPTINMKTGYCGGRDLKIKTDSVKREGNVWIVECERSYDNLLERYFPYSYNVSVGEKPTANESYQIRGSDISGYDGDQFVYTGIPLSKPYIDAASVKLLEEALAFLEKNDYTRYTYQPKIDELLMAREQEDAIAEGRTPLHDLIKEGDLLTFKDDDLLIDYSSIFIDSLTIKEDGNNGVPTYEVTLRNEKTVGTMQRIQNKVEGIVNGSSSGSVTPQVVKDLIKEYTDPRFLSKLKDDEASGNIRIKGGMNVGTGTMGMKPNGDVKAKDVKAETIDAEEATIDEMQSHNFEHGIDNGTGWRIDANGNAEFTSATIRSFLEVIELLVNRIQAQEGDTVFSDNDQIEHVTRRVGANNEVTYLLDLKEKWDGYVTPQMYNNILKGIINTLAAKEAGVSDETGNYDGQEEDDGGNRYYTSWMRVVNTHNTDDSLGLNQIEVVLYGDNDVPAGRNFEPCPMMVIARRGCVDYSDPSDPDYETVKQSIIRRQRFFEISASDGRVTKFTGVDHPKLTNPNYGVTIGELPEFVKAYADVARVLQQVGEHTDWLYAQGIVVQNLIQIDKEGLPQNHYVDCGAWVDGSQIAEPTPRHGEYLYYEFNKNKGQYETHDVWHLNCKWRCLQHQPVVSGGVAHYYEPKWNSEYWKMIEGNPNFSIEFESSKGFSFRRGFVDTYITPILYFGNTVISNDVPTSHWNWTRSSENGKTAEDLAWDAEHTGARLQEKVLHLTNNDMPADWSSSNKAIFTCTITFTYNNENMSVSNQILA